MHLELTDIGNTVLYLRSWGNMGPVVAFVLFYIQAIVPVFPYMILAGAAGMVFGTWGGFLLAWQGALWGAVLVFVLSKRLGKDWFMTRLYLRYEINLEQVDNRVWFFSILIARIFPVVPTPLINVGSGLAGVSFWTFLFSSALGKIPTALIYSALGSQLYKTRNWTQAMMILGVIMLVSFVGIRYFRDRLTVFRRKEE